jgi:hypothetical protein
LRIFTFLWKNQRHTQKVRGLTFRNKLMAYSNTKRRPEFQDQFMLIPDQRTFNWPFLQVCVGVCVCVCGWAHWLDGRTIIFELSSESSMH